MNISGLAAIAAKVGMALAGNAKIAIALSHAKTGSGMTIDHVLDVETPDPAGATITTDARGGPLLAFKYAKKESQRPDQVQQADGKITFYQFTLMIEAAAIPGIEVMQTDYVEIDGIRHNFGAVTTDPGRGAWIADVFR